MPFLAPVIGAVVSTVGAAASFIGGLGFVGKAVIGIGLQLAANAIAKKQQKTSNEPRGTQLEVQYGGSEPRQIGVGLFATAGQDVYTNTFGKANVFITKVFELSDFPISGVSRVAVNGEWRNFVGAEDHRGRSVDGFVGDLWIKIYRGLPGEPADPHLIETSNPPGRWTGDHRGTGVAKAIVLARYDDERMSSFPTLLFEVGGLVYDPRRDSTVGGSGPQRYADVTTWAYSENPIVHAYTYERGFFLNGELLIGKGMPAADLPLGPWMAAMNVCDEAVAGGEARYRAGVIFTAADGTTHRDNLEPVLNAAGAALVERVDGDLPIVGANQPVVATLTDDDLIVGETLTFQAKRSRSTLINAVHGAYNSPKDLWASTAYPAQRDATALAVDRERHAVQIDFGAVYSERQATTLALQALRENRYQASASIVVRPRWIVLEVGDWVRWESARRGTRVYRVVGRQLAPLGSSGARNVSLSLQEVGPGIYDQSVVIPEGPPRVPISGPVYQSTLDDFFAFPSSAEAENGRVYPAIVAQWAAIDDVTVDEVVVEYWKENDPANRIQTRVRQPETRMIIVEGILPETTYVLQGTVITNPPRAVFWSRPQTVTTLSEALAVGMGSLRPDIRYILDQAERNWLHADQLVDELAALATANLTDLELESLRLNSRTFDLGAEVEDTGARLIEETIIRQSETEMLAARAVRVETRLDDAETGLTGQSAALDVLTSRTTTVEGGLETAAESIRGVRSQIVGLEGEVDASGEAISTLQSKVTQQGETITSQGTALTRVRSDLTDTQRDVSGTASSLSQLSSTVTQQGNRITSEAGRTDGVLARIGTAEGQISGQASALTNLSGRVSGTEHDIAAVAERAEDTRARANNASANALMRIVAQAGPSGTSIRHSYEYRLSIENENYQAAGWYVDLSAAGVPTVVFDFARFIITDSSNRKAAPFRFQDGTLFVEALVAASALVGQLRAQSVDTQSLTLGGVQMDRISFGAVSNFASGTRGLFEVAALNREETIIGLNVQATTSKFFNLAAATRIAYGQNQTGATVTVLLRINGQEVARKQYTVVSSGDVLDIDFRAAFPLAGAEGTLVNVQFNIFSSVVLVRPYDSVFTSLSFVR